MLDELTTSEEYKDWQWDLSGRLRRAVETAYAQGEGEVPCVEAMVRAISETKSVTSAQAPGTRVDVEGAFLHGSRSQVKFEIGGVKHQRELADLLVLGSYVESGVLKWQRACFIQAKKGSAAKATAASRFAVDEWQLALLNSFPEFHGVSGVVAGMSCRLRNSTGMLGAYGFLAGPGELSVVSARVLSHVLGGRKSLVGKELTPTLLSERATSRGSVSSPRASWWPIDLPHCPECRGIFEQWFRFHWPRLRQHHLHAHGRGVRGPAAAGGYPPESLLACLGVDEFVNAWTTLRLGESWSVGANTGGDRGFDRSLFSLLSRVARGTGGLTQLLNLLPRGQDNRRPPREVDGAIAPSDGGGLAVVSVVATVSPRE